MSSALNTLFPLADDATPYRRLEIDGVGAETLSGRELVTVQPEALRALSKQAFIDIAHLLRPGHLAQLAHDPRRPRGHLQRPLRRPRPAEERQHRGGRRAAHVPGHRHRHRHGQEGPARLDRRQRRGGALRAASRDLSRDATCATRSSRRSTCTRRRTPAPTCRRRSTSTPPRASDAYKFLFVAKGGGSANKTFLYQETQGAPQPEGLLKLPRREDPLARHLGLPALPPRDRHRRHLGRADPQDGQARLGPLPRRRCPPAATSRAAPSATSSSRRRSCSSRQATGIGAQFGGKYFCHDVRVIRLPRHGASLPGRHRRVLLGRPPGPGQDHRATASSSSSSRPTRRSSCPRSPTRSSAARW